MIGDGGGDADGEEVTSERADENADADTDKTENADVEIVDEDSETHDEPIEDEAALIERVESSSTEEIAREIGTLRERARSAREELDAREETIEELESQLKRTQAEFQNYKKRAERRREDERERATEDLVTRLLDVRDNLGRALDQEGEADIRPGVESTLREFDRVLDDENVTAIEPEPGTEVDPERHEVMLQVDSDQPEDTIAEVFQPGYEMGEKVLRPAQVTVSE